MPIDAEILEMLRENYASVTVMDRTLYDADIQELVQALAQNRTLVSLKLEWCNIAAADMQAVAQNCTLLKGIGFKCNLTNQSQARRFLAACGSGDLTTVRSLLEQKQVSPYAFDLDTGETGWHIALENQQIWVAEFLLKNAPNPQSLFVMNKSANQVKKLKETDGSTLYLKTARAIESYSNATIMNRLLKQNPSTSSASSSRLFASPTAVQSSPLAAAATSPMNPIFT